MTHRIAFLDHDHVMHLARIGLVGATEADLTEMRDFFAPEPFDPARLAAAAHGLRPQDGIDVVQAEPDAAEHATALLFRRGQVTAAMMDRSPGLRLIQRLGAGTAPIDLAAARARGIAVSCLPRPALVHTAEHTMLLMLAVSRRLLDADAALRAGRYDPALLRPADDVAYNWIGLTGLRTLRGRTLGIIGLGEVGALVAGMARGFGMTVLYSNRNPLPPARETELGATWCPLPDLMRRADIVTVHAPSNAATRGLVGHELLARMKPGAILVNTSRGRLVDEDALFEALASGAIAGAGLDVHRVEPRPAADRFCRLPNVVLTPHLAGGSRLGLLDEIAAIYDNCRAALAGQTPPHAPCG